MCSQGVRHAAPRPNFNGATLPPDKEDSFHPNADGQKARGINTVRPAVVTRRPVAAGSSAPRHLDHRLLVNTCTELQRGKWRGSVDGDVPRSGQLVAALRGRYGD
jgi:hypothetical protein